MMRMKKLISLILTLVMMLSLLPMAALAETGAISAVNDEELAIPDLEVRDFDPEDYTDEDEFPVPDMEERDFDPTLTEAEGEEESLFLFAEPDEETFVSVEAPYGALPVLAELKAERVDVEDIREAVEAKMNGEQNILLALDISFWLDGVEIEPAEEVQVRISAPELEGEGALTLVHVPEEAEVETVALIPEEELGFELEVNEIAFESKDFSVYAVLGATPTPVPVGDTYDVAPSVTYKLRWIEAPSAEYEVNEEQDHINITPYNNDSNLTARAQIYFKFNAAETEQLPAGSITFKVPKYIFENWQGGNQAAFGTNYINGADGKYIGTWTKPISWQVPAYPDSAPTSDFNYVDDGDYYLLSNVAPVQGDMSLICDIGYLYRPTAVKVDETATFTNDDIAIQMIVQDEKVVADETNHLSLELHTKAKKGTLSKTQDPSTVGNMGGQWLTWQNAWGEKPADADDYFYIYWVLPATRADNSTIPYDILFEEVSATIDLGAGQTEVLDGQDTVVGIRYYNPAENRTDGLGWYVNHGAKPGMSGIASYNMTSVPGLLTPEAGVDFDGQLLTENTSFDGNWLVLTKYPKRLLQTAKNNGVDLSGVGLKITNKAKTTNLWKNGNQEPVAQATATTYFKVQEGGNGGSFAKARSGGVGHWGYYESIATAFEYLLDLEKPVQLSGVSGQQSFYMSATTLAPVTAPTAGEDGTAVVEPYTTTLIEGDYFLTPANTAASGNGAGNVETYGGTGWKDHVKLSDDDSLYVTYIDLSFYGYKGSTITMEDGTVLTAMGEVIPSAELPELEVLVRCSGETDYSLYGTLKKQSNGTFTFTRAEGYTGGVASKTGIRTGDIAQQVWLPLPSKTCNYKIRVTSEIYHGQLYVYSTMVLRPTEEVKAVMQQARDEGVNAVFTNHAFYRMEDSNRILEGRIPAEGGNDRSESWGLKPLTKKYEAEKTVLPNTSLVDDVVNARQYYDVALRIYFWPNNAKFDAAVWRLCNPETGFFYDLLPAGCTVDVDTVKVNWSYAETTMSGSMSRDRFKVSVDSNWNNTGRDLLTVEILDNIDWNGGTSGGYHCSFRMYNTYTNIVDRGTSAINVFGFVCTDPVATKVAPENSAKLSALTTEEDIMRQLMTELGYTEEYLDQHGIFAQNRYVFRGVGIVQTGFTKTVSTGINSNFSKENETFIGQDYTYNLTYVQKEDTVSNNIVLFDVIEQGSYLTERETEWQGAFRSLDISSIDAKPNNKDPDTTCAPVVYYATTLPTANDLTVDAITAAAAGDDSIWSTTLPDDPGDVVAFAVDCRKDEKGNDFYLLAGATLNLQFHMTAPDDPELAEKYAVNGSSLICDLNMQTGGVTPGVVSDAYCELLLLDPHLEIHKTSDPETGTAEAPTTVEVGSTIKYTLAVSVADEDNGAHYDLTNILVEDPIPDGLTIDLNGIRYYTSSNSALQTLGSGKRAQVRRTGQTLNFTIPTLAKGETIYLVIPTTVEALEESTDLVVYENQARITHYNSYNVDMPSEITYHQAWQVFYVYHSGDRTFSNSSTGNSWMIPLCVERIRLCDERVTRRADGTLSFDIVAETNQGYMYGGYYSKYNRTSAGYDSTALEYRVGADGRDWSADKGGRPYVGGLGYWSGANAYTVNGHDMTPKGGETYYLKEVPMWFLQPYLYVIYDMYAGTDGNGPVVDMYMLGNVDDNNYQTIGLFATDIETGERIKMAVSFTITDTVHGRTDKIDATVVAGASFPGISDVRGYVTVWHPGVQETEHEFVYTPYYITPDGVTVEGCFTRTANTGDGWYYEDDTGTFLEPGIHFTKALNELIKQPGNESTRPPQN